MSDKFIDLDLTNLSDGGVQEKFDMAMQKLLENIHDPNTKATAKRKLTLTLTLEPDDNRQAIKTTSNVSSTLAPLTDISTTILTGRNASGQIEAKELKSRVPGQTFFDSTDGKFKDDVGTPIEDIEKQNQVVDLQKKKQERG